MFRSRSRRMGDRRSAKEVVAGAGSAELQESFTLTADGWVTDNLLPGDVRVVTNPPRPPAPGNP